MSKKTSAYARKRRHIGPVVQFNGAAWMNTIAGARSYDEDDAPAGIESSKSAADKCELRVRMAATGLLTGARPTDPEHDFDVLAHALGVTVVRVLQIDPSTSNPAIGALAAGTAAVRRAIARYESTGAWGLDGPGRQELQDAIDIYADVLRASSPEQMAQATQVRMRLLKNGTRAPVHTKANKKVTA